MKGFFRNNGLSLVLFACFLAFWVGQGFTGWHAFNEELRQHGNAPVSFGEYLSSAHFWEATGENWESEFLQMSAYVLLTCFLFQKGSAESKDPEKSHAKTPGGTRHSFLYRNSLSLAFVLLFLASFAVHAEAGWGESNRRRVELGIPAESFWDFVGGAEFWFQSLQNWQSEFLAVLSIVVLSIFLRQHGSPESKELDAPNSRTGG